MSDRNSALRRFVEATVPPNVGGYASSEEKQWKTFVT
jgi:hypothetical protein